MARAVLRLLGARSGRLARRLADWPGLLNRADDICSLAAQGFVVAHRTGRIAPDALAGEHSAQSVSAYAFGIVSRLFAHELKRLRPRPAPLETLPELDEAPPDDPLAELTAGGPDDRDGRLWGVLRSSKGACRPEDIIVAYLLASGMSSAEVRELLGVSENTPGNALKRVGRELRRQLELGSASVPLATAKGQGPRAEGQGEEEHQSSGGGGPPPSERSAGHQENSGAGVPARHPDAPRDGRATVMDKDGRPMGRPGQDASADARATKTRAGTPALPRSKP